MGKAKPGVTGSLLNVGKLLMGFSDKVPKWFMPLFALSAAAPVIGYAFDRNKKGKPLGSKNVATPRGSIQNPMRSRNLLVDPSAASSRGDSIMDLATQNPYFGSVKNSFVVNVGEARVLSKVALALNSKTQIKLADLDELGLMLRYAKNNTKRNEKSTLLQGVDSEPKDELDPQEQEESRQPEGPKGPSYATIGGGASRG